MVKEKDGLISEPNGNPIIRLLKEYGFLILAFAVPALLMYLIYASMLVHPIGDGSVLILDLNGQYVCFFEALRNVIHGDAGPLYSFARSLGGEFLGIYSYYLASPLSYIVALLPRESILEALLFLFVLKTGLCGFTFAFYLSKTGIAGERQNKPVIVAFSVMYALSAYCVVLQHNTMWIDAVIWLPIIAYGIEELIKKGHYKVFVISLSISVISNFYIGYMTCIFCAIYFFAYYFMHNENGRNNPYKEEKHFARSLLRMILFSALSIAISAVVVFSAYYSLSFGKNNFSSEVWALKTNFNLYEFLVKFLPCSYDTVQLEGLPFVYCGTCVLLLVPAFFFSKRFTPREKIVSGILASVFVLSFILYPVDLFWHGLQHPNWLNYRYSFMFVFVILVIAYKGMIGITKTKSIVLLISASLLVLFACIVKHSEFSSFILDKQEKTVKYIKGKVLTVECVIFTIVLALLFLLIIFLFKTKKRSSVLAILFAVLVSVEAFCNGLSNCLGLGSDVYYTSYSEYHDVMDPLYDVKDFLDGYDGSMYRSESVYHRKANDNIAVNLYGMTGSTSTLNATTIRLLRNFGYVGKSHESRYCFGNTVSDSVLGLKYIIVDDLDEFSEVEANRTLLDDERLYELCYDFDGYKIYRNRYAFSLAYAMNNKVMDLDPADYRNPYEFQNALITALLGESETVQVFREIGNVDISLDNLVTKPWIRTDMSNYKYNFTEYKKENDEEKASLSILFTVPKSNDQAGVQYVYFYLPSEFQQGFSFANKYGSYGVCYDYGEERSVFCGSYEEGKKVKFKLTLEENELYITDDVPMIYVLDVDAYVSAMEKLYSKNQLKTNENVKNDRFSGSITTTERNTAIMTSIPYDLGWQIKVDGKEVELSGVLSDSDFTNKSRTNGSLLTFNIEEIGEHHVEFVYRPKAFTVGFAVTVIAIVLFVLIIIFENKINKLLNRIGLPLTVPIENETKNGAEYNSENGDI